MFRLKTVMVLKAADRATAVLDAHRANLMFQPGVMGAGVGLSGRADGQAAIGICK